MNENEITYQISGAALEVHKSLGPGLLESDYQECIAYKLQQLDFSVEKENPMPLVFEGVKLE